MSHLGLNTQWSAQHFDHLLGLFRDDIYFPLQSIEEKCLLGVRKHMRQRLREKDPPKPEQELRKQESRVSGGWGVFKTP